ATTIGAVVVGPRTVCGCCPGSITTTAFLAASDDAVSATGLADRLGRRKAAQSKLEVRFRRVTVSLKDCYFVGASLLQAHGRHGQGALSTVAVLAASCAGRVECHACNGIFRVGASITGNQIANRVACWNHRAVGLACGVGARQVDIPALLDGGVSGGVNFHAGGHTLV